MTVTCFEFPDRERFTALLASLISFPDEGKHVRGVGTFFLVAACARGCYVLHIALEFNLARI